MCLQRPRIKIFRFDLTAASQFLDVITPPNWSCTELSLPRRGVIPFYYSHNLVQFDSNIRVQTCLFFTSILKYVCGYRNILQRRLGHKFSFEIATYKFDSIKIANRWELTLDLYPEYSSVHLFSLSNFIFYFIIAL